MIWPLDYHYTEYLGIPVWEPAQIGSKPWSCSLCRDNQRAAVIINLDLYIHLCPHPPHLAAMARLNRNHNKGQPNTPTQWAKQEHAKQHLQERQDLQKKSRAKAKERELLAPRIWNPETQQYEIAVWDEEKRQWRSPE